MLHALGGLGAAGRLRQSAEQYARLLVDRNSRPHALQVRRRRRLGRLARCGCRSRHSVRCLRHRSEHVTCDPLGRNVLPHHAQSRFGICFGGLARLVRHSMQTMCSAEVELRHRGLPHTEHGHVGVRVHPLGRQSRQYFRGRPRLWRGRGAPHGQIRCSTSAPPPGVGRTRGC